MGAMAALAAASDQIPKIDAAYLHNDDMALAAYEVMKARDRMNIKIGGGDAMPPALQAVADRRMVATVRNPSCRSTAAPALPVWPRLYWAKRLARDRGMIPKHVVTNGPIVTKANALGLVG